MSVKLLGIDTGGTFTDFVYVNGGKIRIHKVLSTPQAPEQAIFEGIAEIIPNLDVADIYIVHGSTVATNAVLEAKGVPTVLLTNAGLKDLLHIGRQARAQLYELEPQDKPLPLPAACCIEVPSRIGANGEVVTELSSEQIESICAQVNEIKPQAVAINLLFSFLDASAEKQLEDALGSDVFVSRSSYVLPEYREFERGIATWLNAWVGPIMYKYLQKLGDKLGQDRLSVMQSSGGTIKALLASRRSIDLLLSGPAGGLAAARFVAAQSHKHRLLTFDMGGTSTDVALIDGDLRLTTEGYIGPYPVAVPMVDMVTIGAGGGSIAYVDAGNMLQVGPESAGAEPGPACYGKGGTQATVTDANVVLGRICADNFLGGRMSLRQDLAVTAVDKIAKQLGLDRMQTAAGIIRLANEHMARALRIMSVQRGLSPADLCLVSFGGAGGLHVCALAEALRIKQALVPIHAGVLSALGMLVAPRSRQLSHTVMAKLEQKSEADIDEHFNDLISQGSQELMAEGVAMADIRAFRSLDLRYFGQSYHLNVSWFGLEDARSRFHQLHRDVYGHDLKEEVELVNLRVGLQGPQPEIHIGEKASSAQPVSAPGSERSGLPVYDRELLDTVVSGPALILEPVSTTYVAESWQCHKDSAGNLLLTQS